MSKSVIKINNACVYLDGREILHNFELDIPRGRHTFILGPNGSGKTTLVKLLLGHVYPAVGGSIEVLGRKFGSSDIRELRRHIAVASPMLSVFTDINLSGLEIVLTGIDSVFGIFREYSEHEKELAMLQLEKFNALHLADRSFKNMSSGEQIRVLIARAIVCSPALLILDEPSVFLDPAGREKLLSEIALLPEKNPEITMLFITQRIEDITPCFAHGVLIADGRNFDSGNTSTLLTEEKLSKIFNINIKLVPGINGRLWSICV
ncbi:MAG: ATP-binding cassette domain-containing protein [Lentisphaeria bacterium]|nr:ATP-binding cassette domain-containing protein [Lentisphaeria bacterium]